MPPHSASRGSSGGSARRFIVVSVLALAALVGWSGAGPGGAEPEARRFIVVLRDDVGDPGAVAAEHARRFGATVDFVYAAALKGYAAMFRGGGPGAAASDGRVAFVEPDGEMTAWGTGPAASWGLDRIDQRYQPLNGTYTYANTGAGVTAYIIDTGIFTGHSDFGGRASVGFDALGGNGQDCHGHGTHVAGTVGGRTYGVAKDVALVAVRVLDCGGSGTTAGVIAGVDWVTASRHGAAVANMSLGGGASSALDSAVRRSITSGVSYAVAAGNGNILGWQSNACWYSPSRVTEAMTTSATSSSDTKASWANYGTCVDWFAPGVGITSAWKGGDAATATISGTSMAAPHTAGAAALFLQSNPGASPATVEEALRSAATTNVVTSAGSGSPNRLLYVAPGGAG